MILVFLIRLPGDELVGWSFRPVLRVHHEQHMRESGAEVGAVRVVVLGRLGRVHVHALWAVQLHHGFAGNVRQADRQHWLVLAVHSWTKAKVPILVFLQLDK